jgi:hypothetical protein
MSWGAECDEVLEGLEYWMSLSVECDEVLDEV